MLSIFICEDQEPFLNRIYECISEYINDKQLDVTIACSTPFPDILLEYLQENSVFGLYFLDLELNATMDGFQLATEIRKYDPRAFIVIVTSDLESKHLSFKYVIEAMDYVTKDMVDFNNRICNCVSIANDRHIERMSYCTKKLEVKLSEDARLKNKIKISKGEFAYLDFDDIFYIEVTAGKAHQITVHAATGQYESRSDLNKIQKSLDNRFVRCYKSFIVNIKKIQRAFETGR